MARVVAIPSSNGRSSGTAHHPTVPPPPRMLDGSGRHDAHSPPELQDWSDGERPGVVPGSVAAGAKALVGRRGVERPHVGSEPSRGAAATAATAATDGLAPAARPA